MLAGGAAIVCSANVAVGPTPATDAAMTSVPTTLPSVYITDARPSLPVIDEGAASAPLPDVRDQLTVTPETGLSKASLTRATSGLASACSATSDCPPPDTAATFAGSPASAVAGIDTVSPAATAEKVCWPMAPPKI